MKELIGKTIKGYSLKEEGTILEFDVIVGDETKTKKIIYRTEGDCCSTSWFESIDGDLFAGKVLNVEEVEMEDANLKPHPQQEEDQLYGYKLTLEGHIVDIVYRNSSNGYYGGWCELVIDETKETL